VLLSRPWPVAAASKSLLFYLHHAVKPRPNLFDIAKSFFSQGKCLLLTTSPARHTTLHVCAPTATVHQTCTWPSDEFQSGTQCKARKRPSEVFAKIMKAKKCIKYPPEAISTLLVSIVSTMIRSNHSCIPRLGSKGRMTMLAGVKPLYCGKRQSLSG